MQNVNRKHFLMQNVNPNDTVQHFNSTHWGTAVREAYQLFLTPELFLVTRCFTRVAGFPMKIPSNQSNHRESMNFETVGKSIGNGNQPTNQ